MAKFNNFVLRGKARVAFAVPVTSGNYANERITFGEARPGQPDQDFTGFTALIEGPIVPGATLELWLPRVADGGEAAGARTDADYTNSGLATLTAAGAISWGPLGGWVGAQIRVKSGGTAGTLNVSATAL